MKVQKKFWNNSSLMTKVLMTIGGWCFSLAMWVEGFDSASKPSKEKKG